MTAKYFDLLPLLEFTLKCLPKADPSLICAISLPKDQKLNFLIDDQFLVAVGSFC